MNIKEFDRHKWRFLEKWSYLWNLKIGTKEYDKAREIFEEELKMLIENKPNDFRIKEQLNLYEEK